MPKRTTLQNIADLTGFSKSTVSRALNHDPKISQQTSRLIQKIAKRNNYHPNLVAKSIKTHHTKIIGIIVPTFDNQFFSRILNTIQLSAEADQYHLMINTTNEQPENEINAVKGMLDQMVDGIIVASTGMVNNYRKLIGDTPIVFVDRIANQSENQYFDNVLVDNINGSYNIVQQMLQNGAERIGIIGNALFKNKSNRIIGYQRALLDHQIKLDADIIKYGQQDGNDIAQLASQLLVNQACDGIFATDNTILRAVLKQIAVHNVTNIQVGTFDDNPYLSLLNIPIVANQQPASKMGFTAYQMLMDQINHQDQHQVHHIKLKTSIKNYI